MDALRDACIKESRLQPLPRMMTVALRKWFSFLKRGSAGKLNDCLARLNRSCPPTTRILVALGDASLRFLVKPRWYTRLLVTDGPACGGYLQRV